MTDKSAKVNNFYNTEKGVQIGTVNLFAPGGRVASGSEYYNLIIGFDPFATDYIELVKYRFLTEYIEDSVKEAFDGKLEEIQQLPTIIINELHKGSQKGALVRINQILMRQDRVVAYFTPYSSIPMSYLTKNSWMFGLSMPNEPYRTHWTIKNINLMERLKQKDFMDPKNQH